MSSSESPSVIVDRGGLRREEFTGRREDGKFSRSPVVRLAAIASLFAGVIPAASAQAQAPASAQAPAPASAQAPAPAQAPASAPAPPSASASEASRVESSAGRPIVWIGATIFSLAYIGSSLAATTSYLSDTDITTPHGALWIPVAGPFVVMGKTSGAGSEILLALDGLAQIAGLALFVYGQTTPRTSQPADHASALTVSVAPLVARGTGGAAVFAAF